MSSRRMGLEGSAPLIYNGNCEYPWLLFHGPNTWTIINASLLWFLSCLWFMFYKCLDDERYSYIKFPLPVDLMLVRTSSSLQTPSLHLTWECLAVSRHGKCLIGHWCTPNDRDLWGMDALDPDRSKPSLSIQGSILALIPNFPWYLQSSLCSYCGHCCHSGKK